MRFGVNWATALVVMPGRFDARRQSVICGPACWAGSPKLVYVGIQRHGAATCSRLHWRAACPPIPGTTGFLLRSLPQAHPFSRSFSEPRMALSGWGLTVPGRYGSTRLASAAEALCSSAPSERYALRLTRSPGDGSSSPHQGLTWCRAEPKKTE